MRTTGQVVITSNLMQQCPQLNPYQYIEKHLQSEEFEEEAMVLTEHFSPDGTKFWIITEWDRSVTTFLLPEDY